ncbi:segregation and condensation protein A [Nguyenibacter vanlangensis]|uniref:Segregation and condensation protein A n=1 Tax=Nguyenibacter vanlangensis TaxID=1216886 RepID=A0A7Y7M7B0_9PROT|nr:ScpA family protein [Nguyenibacter vanlangensis]NVN12907.1 segregation/condensation protein A [Nguyenibacter vanlangensis]
MLRLDGFEGPLDLLLELARAQKVDLARISILQLVEQYLAIVESARRIRLELAADWLVMAAWLAWLKSRLLLPAEEGGGEDAEDAAELLQARLLELARIGQAAEWLAARPQLGRDVFARGEREDLTEIDRSGLALDLPQLMGAYMAAMRRGARKRVYQPRRLQFWTVQDALARLHRLLGTEAAIPGTGAGWCALDSFLPESGPGLDAEDDLERTRLRRAAMAGTLIAGLELARNGAIELRQEEIFGRIMLRACDPAGQAANDQAASDQADEQAAGEAAPERMDAAE